jgi:hypothetical protein
VAAARRGDRRRLYRLRLLQWNSKVQAQFGPWTVTLDTHTVHTGHAHFTYTRMRAPYVNPEGLRFTG